MLKFAALPQERTLTVTVTPHQSSGPEYLPQTSLTHPSGVKVVSKCLDSCAETLPLSTFPAYLCRICEGDRRGSNPRPSLEPQSADTRFYVRQRGANKPCQWTEDFLYSEYSAYLSEERADERTRTADLISLRVITHALQGFAQACISCKAKRFNRLWVAPCCTVLRSRCCQSGVNTILLAELPRSSCRGRGRG